MALYHRRYQRGFSSLLISLIVHLSFLIVFSFLMVSRSNWSQQEEMEVDLVLLESKTPTTRRRPPKTLDPLRALSTQPSMQLPRQSVQRDMAEAIQKSQQSLLHDATLERTRPLTDQLPELTTAAENLRTSERTQISRAMSSRELPGTGDGMESFRQRAGGQGAGGLPLSGPTEAAPIDLPPGKIGLEPPTEPTGVIRRTPFGEALFRIGEHIASTSTTGVVDTVFVIDTSKSMQDNVVKVAKELYSMTDALDREMFDYRLGVVEFSVRHEGNRIIRDPLTEDPAILQQRMQKLRVSGDEHALDALVNTLAYIQFRGSSDRHLILVTDEPASTSWAASDSYSKLRKQILDECRQKGIAVNILGYSENYQRNLANLTGGLWQEIPGGQRDSAKSQVVSSSEQLLTVFRDVARRIWQASQQDGEADIVVMVDYSGSMGSKAVAMTQGLGVFQGMLSRYPLDVMYGMIRFAVQPENIGGIKGHHVIQIPIDPDALTMLLGYPFAGNEKLLDAIVEALPQIGFRPDAVKSLVILTDEPSTGEPSVQDAIQVCQTLGIHVYVLGYVPPGISADALYEGGSIRSSEFQVLAPSQTGGLFYPIPGSLSYPDETQ